MNYDPQKIEPKWQKKWEKLGLNQARDFGKKPKYYCLDMFPYPSAAGLHVGHPEGYTATDILSRYKRMNGFNVLHPMGWDAFGLPAENYAIKMKVNPAKITKENIKNFTRQIKSLGFSYDWNREINTSDPDYYKWTQWLFLLLYKNNLAYKKKAPVNWCPHCQTVLANEQVIDGKCERCKNEVVQKELEQWFFKVTKYADELLNGLDELDWPEPLKQIQRNWIGKSAGAEIDFKVKGSRQAIKVFTTRPDTLFGATYLVLAPENSLVQELVAEDRKQEAEKYIKAAQKKSHLERTDLAKDKTGVFIGAYAVNPATNQEIPVWISDYVMMDYGTGAIMAVPAHDQRDFEFAKKFKLPIFQVIRPDKEVIKGENQAGALKEAYTGDGQLINSGKFDGLKAEQAKKEITKAVQGRKKTIYKIRDWLISRQRYWGAPIPIIYCDQCGQVPVPEKNLPVILPDDVDFKPTGESPLVKSKKFHNVKCPQCGGAARRESDTMDTFVCSAWYYFRYLDPRNSQQFCGQKKIKYWLPVDLYIGGAEHAAGHLIYSRFITKVLRDLGYVGFEEPFLKLVNQGLILAEDGRKMSKSLGNVINPDEVVARYGADTMRMYEMFMGPLEDTKPWNAQGMVGVRRFLDKVWSLRQTDNYVENKEMVVVTHKTINKVTEDIKNFKFNTAVSALMIWVNEMTAKDHLLVLDYQNFLKILAPFAPHIAEELWSALGKKESIFQESWPKHDDRLTVDQTVTLIVQINGKVRDKIEAKADLTEEEAKNLVYGSGRIKTYIEGKKIKKIIYIQGRLINIVV
ncbi:MAG TPA: leucine--tRNA ligase [Patescibacteria group bacterium]